MKVPKKDIHAEKIDGVLIGRSKDSGLTTRVFFCLKNCRIRCIMYNRRKIDAREEIKQTQRVAAPAVVGGWWWWCLDSLGV